MQAGKIVVEQDSGHCENRLFPREKVEQLADGAIARVPHPALRADLCRTQRQARASRAAGALLLAAGSLTSVSAMAEEVATAPEPLPVIPVPEPAPDTPSSKTAHPANRFIEEVLVTAQKREENLQDVPIAVAAFSSDMLDARGISDPRELTQVVPGLHFSESVGFSIVYLRGLGSDAFLLGDPSVAYYIDDIYFPFAQGLAQNFGAVERVEVLKGPQGTLFGRNATGGAINIHSKMPDLNHTETSIQSSYGSYNQLQNRVFVSLPLSDSVAMSLSAYYNHGDFYQDGTAAGKPLDPLVDKGAQLKLRYSPDTSLDMLLSGVLVRHTGAGSFFQLNAAPSPIVGATIQPQYGYNGAVSEPIYNALDNKVLYGQIRYSMPWLDMKLLGSDQHIENSSIYDLDGSPQPIYSTVSRGLYADVQTAELQFLSNDESWGHDWLKWIAGSYFFHNRQGYRGNDHGLELKIGGLTNPTNAISQAVYDLLSVAAPNALDGTLTNGVPITSIIGHGQTGDQSIAFFGQGTIEFTHWLSLTLGGRYQRETRRVLDSYNSLGSTGNGTAPIYPLDPASSHQSKTISSAKPKASLELRPFKDTLVYLTVQQAIKSQNYNTLTILQPPNYVKPEEITSYELGVKGRLFDGLMTFSAAAFQYDARNFQVQYQTATGGGIVLENAKAARVRGIDFDSTVLLFPNLVDSLVLTAGGALIDAQYTDYKNGSGYNETTGIFQKNQDFSGNQIVRTPRFSGSTSLSKTWQVPGGTVELSGDAYFSTSLYFTAQDTANVRQGSYQVYGAHIAYLYEPWQLRITGYGKNLSNTFYTESVVQVDTGVNRTLGAPDTYGLRLNWDF